MIEHDRGEHLLPRQAAKGEIVREPGAHLGEGAGEREQAIELRLVARGAPLRVVAVLLAAARVAAGRKDVSARVRADPHVRPGRRNRDRGDALPLLGVADRRAVRVPIRESASRPAGA